MFNFILLVVCSDLLEYTTLPKVTHFGSFAGILLIPVSSESAAENLRTRRQVTPLCFFVTCISLLSLKGGSLFHLHVRVISGYSLFLKIQPGASHGYKVSMIFPTELRAIISVTLC